MTLFVKLLENFPLEGIPPREALTPAHPTDAGIDLCAAEDVVLAPGERALVGTGVAISLPEGLEAQIRPRSGQAYKRGLTVLNTPGTIDPGYRGEVKVLLYNSNPVYQLEDLQNIDSGAPWVRRLKTALEARRLTIEKGERIAQMVIARFQRPEVQIVETLPDSVRGEGGIGSTGRKTRPAEPNDS